MLKVYHFEFILYPPNSCGSISIDPSQIKNGFPGADLVIFVSNSN
jgi:hypothetical protein